MNSLQRTDSPSIYDSPEYRRSRSAYRWECTFEYFVSLFAGNAFLTSLSLPSLR